MKKELFTTDNWNNYLRGFPEERTDIYFEEEYVKLYGQTGKVECFVYKEEEKTLLFPYIKREIDLLGGECFDVETPYGYGGPIANTSDPDFINRAFGKFCHFAKENRMIAALIRFHPLLKNQAHLPDECDVIFDRKTVVMDLEADEDSIWNEQIHPSHRRHIKKARAAELVYRTDEDLESLDEFKKMYIATMDRIKAESFYFFDDTYFNSIRNLKDEVFLGMVLLEGRMISGALFFRHGMFGHYHLGGSLEAYRQYRPNNLLFYNAALYMKKKGVKVFHLGGGTDSREDNSLYKFKRKFSKDERSFYIGKLILDEDMYKEVCSVWEKKFPDKKEKYGKLILKYRY